MWKLARATRYLLGSAIFLLFVFFTLSLVTRAELIELNPGDSIQQGIDSAAPGDTIFLKEGIYQQSFTLNKTINIRGEKGTVIQLEVSGGSINEGNSIGGDINDGSIVVTGYGASLSTFEIRGGETGIHAVNSENVTFKDLTFDNQSKYGILIEDCSNITTQELHVSHVDSEILSMAIKYYNTTDIFVSHLNLTVNSYGLYFSSCENVRVDNCTFLLNIRSGIYLLKSDLTLTNSKFEGNDIGLRTLDSQFSSSYTFFSNNTRYGGFTEDSKGTFINCTFLQNLYALRIRNSVLTIEYTFFTNNENNLDLDDVSKVQETENHYIGGGDGKEGFIPGYVFILLIAGILILLKYRLPERKWEWIVEKSILLAGLSSIFFILLIFYFLMREGLHTFEFVSLKDFLLGKHWNPSFEQDPKYGILALIVSTFLVTAGAVVIAVPIGIAASVYLSEFASPKVREFIKPSIELLVGIPSVVYGFFALIILADWVDNIFGATTRLNALLGSIMLSVMMIPIIVSLSEDALRSVPQELREASMALGASEWETSRRVMIPAALSGIIGAIILGIARAVGETMTVLMATGNSPAFTFNMLQSVRTMTATIAIEMGEVAIPSNHYYALFGIGIILFVITFIINLSADIILNKFRERYV